jgi:hypothetical protein
MTLSARSAGSPGRNRNRQASKIEQNRHKIAIVRSCKKNKGEIIIVMNVVSNPYFSSQTASQCPSEFSNCYVRIAATLCAAGA